MGEVRNIRSEPRSDIVCLEGNGYRPSHKGDGYRITLTECSPIIRTLESMKRKHQGRLIPMGEILRVTKGEYVLSKFIILDHHPQDSRLKISEQDVCQTLATNMGSGGGNVPLVLCFTKSRRAQSKVDYETWIESDASNTINTFDMGDVRATTLVVHGTDSEDLDN